VRYFKGSTGQGAAVLDISSEYNGEDRGAIEWRITNIGGSQAEVSVLHAHTGNSTTQLLQPRESFENELSLHKVLGWYDLTVTVAGDPTFQWDDGRSLPTEALKSGDPTDRHRGSGDELHSNCI
jgi:hypothetical protein